MLPFTRSMENLGRTPVVFFNYAHVPMSPRARTSVLIEWLRSKVYKKDWIWVTLWLTGYSWVASYMLVWFIVVLARHLQCNNCYWHFVRLGTLVPRCVLCVSTPYHLHWLVGRASGSHCGFYSKSSCVHCVLRVLDNQWAAGLGAVISDSTPSHIGYDYNWTTM